MAVAARRVLGLLPGFAVAVEAAWTTRSGGEDAVVYTRGSLIDGDTIAVPFREHPDAYVLDVDLDLVLTAPDGVTEVLLEDGAWLWLEHCGDQLLVDLGLNADLYARRTWGRSHDNRVLADLNAPRLNSFLASLAAALRVPLEVDANEPRYREQVTERGFHVGGGSG